VQVPALAGEGGNVSLRRGTVPELENPHGGGRRNPAPTTVDPEPVPTPDPAPDPATSRRPGSRGGAAPIVEDPERRLSDCCAMHLPPVEIRIDRRHRRWGARTIRVHDGRAKHWKHIRPTQRGTGCDVRAIADAVGQDADRYGPCMRTWIAEARAKNADYGGQMGSDSAVDRAEIVKKVVEEGEEINRARYWGDAEQEVGVDIETGVATTMARVDGLPGEAHVIPQARRPT
jgi:hypothetical protein